MGAINIQVNHHRATLDKQRVDRAIQRPNFVVAWEYASEAQELEVKGYIAACDYRGVESWIRRLNFGDLQALTTKELRRQASNYHVSNYSRLTKDELVEALENVC